MAISPVQRVLIIISGAAFLGSMGFMGLSMMDNRPSPNTAQNTAQRQPTEATGDLVQQAEGYESVLEREPENLNALQGLINARLQMQQYEKAIAPLETMSELQPENPQVWQALTAVHIQSQDFEGAIAPMEKLIELQPENEELKVQLDKLKEVAENPEILQSPPPSPASTPDNEAQ
ncbi:tetratricopeptide repeat protein [Spirulina sp. CS-785/01]|uniref:tetratricopeptide repeat protein n=1 Tax=Spirulina sp. CS-785/01 TaxID=3021716 RepID=UPI0023314B0E|nr:tetratricopeptide repeat protein [Spirulina sp. CS-785/01]MDB9313507.1 tetratricopeptide repeat protein [Spirulina sp. CS-785/01]